MTHENHNDRPDAPIDQDKRSVLRSLGALSTAAVAGPALLGSAPAAQAAAGGVCVMSPVGLQGPFYLNLNKVRSDIREARPGVRLDLMLKLIDNKTCKPYKNAVIDIWQCDAVGKYAGYPHISSDVPGYTPVPLGQMPVEAPMLPPINTEAWLRGAQVTNAFGDVKFTTIYPSWYATRTIHIHVKVYLGLPTTGQTAVFTSQLYFDEAVTQVVLAKPPYSGRAVPRDTTNATDRHFVAMNGANDMLNLRQTSLGYEGALVLGVTLT